MSAADVCASKHFGWHELWHPLCGQGYQFWSGVGSDLGELTLVGSVLLVAYGAWRRHSCHVARCPRLSWHPHPEHGHPVCKRHHPHDAGNLTEEVTDG